jgi:predicted Zn-dependent peptidase
VFRASFQSKSRTVAYAASIVLEEMKRLLGEAVSEEELNTSKRSYIDSFPQAFATKAQVATRFADDEFTGRYARDPHYWRNYRQRIEAVTREDVRRVAAKWLKPQDVIVLAVGQREEILKGHPDHPVKLTDLTRGEMTQLPLRDPLTLEPMK